MPRAKTDNSTVVVSTQAILTMAGNSHRKWSRMLCPHRGKFTVSVHNITELAKLIPQTMIHLDTQTWIHDYKVMQGLTNSCETIIGHDS